MPKQMGKLVRSIKEKKKKTCEQNNYLWPNLVRKKTKQIFYL